MQIIPHYLPCLNSPQLHPRSAIAEFYGSLTTSHSPFPYFLLVALEGGSLFRAIIFFAFSPLSLIVYHLVSEAAGIQIFIFLAFAGLRVRDIEAVAMAVLPKFYAEDVHPYAYRLFSSCGRRHVVTANPRIMVEHFAREHLGADMVLGTEIAATRGGRATGFVKSPGVLVGLLKRSAVKAALGDEVPDIAIGNMMKDYEFMSLSKECYSLAAIKVDPLPNQSLLKPVIFHDGRLVNRPTPLTALLTFIWLPLALLISLLRVALTILLPLKYTHLAYKLLGVRLIVRGNPPKAGEKTLFVCSHRTVIDGIILSVAMKRPVAVLTYSVSRVAEFFSPIRAVRLSRDRERDGASMKELLREGELTICPEGTTCREPYLLRFSCLFAELTQSIVPVGVRTRFEVFQGTSVRGWKCMDPLFCFMNPFPLYEVTFLERLQEGVTCMGGSSSIDVANHVQQTIAEALGFQCTSYTRKEKYRLLAGTDGLLPPRTTSS